MLTRGVVALQEHRLDETQLQSFAAGTRGAELLGIPAVKGPQGKPAGGVALVASAASGWRLGKTATTVVPGRAMAVDAWWISTKYRVVVLHLAPGSQLDIIQQVDRQCGPLCDAEYVILGDSNFQSGLHSTAERAKREEALTRQLGITLARLAAVEIGSFGK